MTFVNSTSDILHILSLLTHKFWNTKLMLALCAKWVSLENVIFLFHHLLSYIKHCFHKSVTVPKFFIECFIRVQWYTRTQHLIPVWFNDSNVFALINILRRYSFNLNLLYTPSTAIACAFFFHLSISKFLILRFRFFALNGDVLFSIFTAVTSSPKSSAFLCWIYCSLLVYSWLS